MENTEKKTFTIGTILLIVTPIILTGAVLAFIFFSSLKDVKSTLTAMQGNDSSNLKETVEWSNDEARDLFKKKQWLLRQLELSEDNTMSLGINMKDSIFQLQLNGLILIQSKIHYMHPKSFLDDESVAVYDKLFLQAQSIDVESASEPKRVLTKKKVLLESEETEAKSDTITQENTVVDSTSKDLKSDTLVRKELHWEFIMNNMMKVVVMGLSTGPDSLIVEPSFEKEIMANRNETKYQAIDSLSYHPTIYIWLQNQDAKSIYRALPEKANVVIRN